MNFAKLLTIFTNNLVVLGDWATKSKNLTANIQYKISVQGICFSLDVIQILLGIFERLNIILHIFLLSSFSVL